MGVGGNFVSRLSKTPSVLLINPLLRSSSHRTRIRSGWSGIASGTLRSNPRLQNQQLLAGPLDEHSNPPLPVSQKPGSTTRLWRASSVSLIKMRRITSLVGGSASRHNQPSRLGDFFSGVALLCTTGCFSIRGLCLVEARSIARS